MYPSDGPALRVRGLYPVIVRRLLEYLHLGVRRDLAYDRDRRRGLPHLYLDPPLRPTVLALEVVDVLEDGVLLAVLRKRDRRDQEGYSQQYRSHSHYFVSPAMKL